LVDATPGLPVHASKRAHRIYRLFVVSLAGGDEDPLGRQQGASAVVRGKVVEDEHVTLLPPELDALLLDNLAAALHDVRGGLGPIGERGRSGLLAVQPHHRVEPHPPLATGWEHGRELARAEHGLHRRQATPCPC
jgi:hypothetical protein